MPNTLLWSLSDSLPHLYKSVFVTEKGTENDSEMIPLCAFDWPVLQYKATTKKAVQDDWKEPMTRKGERAILLGRCPGGPSREDQSQQVEF